MSLKSDNPQDDEISQLLDKLYEELMMRRIEYMKLQRKKAVDLEEKLIEIDNLNENFHSILKAHTAYWKYKKATGQTNTDHSATLLAQIREVVSNMGSIVSEIPKN